MECEYCFQGVVLQACPCHEVACLMLHVLCCGDGEFQSAGSPSGGGGGHTIVLMAMLCAVYTSIATTACDVEHTQHHTNCCIVQCNTECDTVPHIQTVCSAFTGKIHIFFRHGTMIVVGLLRSHPYSLSIMMGQMYFIARLDENQFCFTHACCIIIWFICIPQLCSWYLDLPRCVVSP